MSGMKLDINGSVTGRLLACGMARAQALTPIPKSKEIPAFDVKQAAGIGVFNAYLGIGSTRSEDWKRITILSPQVALARACLNRKWLDEAAGYFESVTDADARKSLLTRILTPHVDDARNLMGHIIPASEQSTSQSIHVPTGFLETILTPMVPALELELVSVPDGKFFMGSKKISNEEFSDGKPHEVIVVTVHLGKYEVTNAQFEIFMDQTGPNEPLHWKDPFFGSTKKNNPVVGVSWFTAAAFCDWLGMRLPTEAEWEFAARGPEHLEYPWGENFDPAKVTFDQSGTRRVDAHANAPSPFGVVDLSGNAWEWVGDWYANRYNPRKLENSQGPDEGAYKVLRGGSWYGDYRSNLRGAYRFGCVPKNPYRTIGFRVSYSGA